MDEIDYRYNEAEIIEQIKEYVDKTYTEHYSRNRFQASEFIIDNGHGIGFTIGNVMKYAQRYGVKGNPKDWRKDLMKVIHYAIMAMYTHDLDHREEEKLASPTVSQPQLLNENDGEIIGRV